MPQIAAVATEVPPHAMRQEDAKRFVRAVFGGGEELDRLLPVFDNALIEKRHSVEPMEWFEQPHTFEEVNQSYIEHTLDLSKRAITKLAGNLSMDTDEFDVVIFVSTTGLSTPSIDARLFNEIK